MKLKNKMLGKKRELEEINLNDAAVPAHEDDEEESKSRVIQKKPRVDPFASTKKKGKGMNAPAMVSFNKLAGSPPVFEARPEKERVVASPNIDQNTPGPSSSTNVSQTALASEWVFLSSLRVSRLTCNNLGQPRLMSGKMKKRKGNPSLGKQRQFPSQRLIYHLF